MAFIGWKNFELILVNFLMNLKIKVLFIFSLSLVFFLACEDEEGKDLPKELVGTWYLHEANSSLELTSKIDQTALDPFSKVLLHFQ